jgi:ABC-2 type transport system permease protein
MNSLLTVIRFTFLNRVRSKPFLISSIIFVLLISLGVNLPAIIDKFSSGGPTVVGVVDDTAGIGKALQSYFQKQEDPDFEVKLYPSAGSKEADDKQMTDRLVGKEVKGWLQLTPDPAGGFPSATYKAESIIGSGKKSALQEALRNVKIETLGKTAGITQEQFARVFGPVSVESIQISTTGGELQGKTEAERNTAYGLVYILIFLLFMMVTMYGNLIATEITAEKSSRVMEIVITSVSPLKQMFGKIIGMFLLGLTQILLFVVAGAFNIFVIKNNVNTLEDLGLNLHSIDGSLLAYFIIFFVLGFFLYATLLAGVGSLVSRTEELGQAILPVTMLSLASFYISIYGLNNPSSTFITAMSFVPFFTPMLMLLRIGMIGVPFWEVGLSLIIFLIGIFIFGWLAAKLYRVGVLMYGKRPTVKEVIRAMRAFKV